MTSPLVFLKEVRTEMSQVSWPNRKEVIRLTTIVVAISVLVGLFVGGLDFIFTNLMRVIMK